MQTKYHPSYLTHGCWSPTRTGLFFLARMDGFIDVWDYHYRQNEIAYSHKISDCPLTNISINGKMAAIGDSEGTVTMMQLCEPLYVQQKNEKEIMNHIFEREYRREKNLEVAKKLAESKKPVKKVDGADEADFFSKVGLDAGEIEEAKKKSEEERSKREKEGGNEEAQPAKAGGAAPGGGEQ
jgi:dynein intermediate chain 2